MRYEERPPCAPLAPFVKCLWRLRGAPSEIEAQPIIPDGGAELIVHLGEPFIEHGGAPPRKQPRALLAATLTRPIVVVPGGAVDVLGVRFRPGAVYPFLALPAVEVVDAAVPAGDAVTPDLLPPIDRLEPAGTADLLAALERALSTRLARSGSDHAFDRLLRALLRPEPALSIGSLAFSAGTSVRQLERRFKQRAGVSPKVLQRIVRFHRAATRLLDGGGALAEIAVDAGFFDQAHMNREFRLLAATSPGRYLDQAGTLDRLFAGQ